jgi:hydroxyacylglutathione hydrolase
LSHSDEELFVRELSADQPEPPRYFAMMKRVNKEGPAVLHRLRMPEHYPFNRLEQVLEDGLPVVDARSATAFSASHIPGTINIPYDYSFANWAGWLLEYNRPFYLIVEHHALEEVALDLASIGLDNCAGYFENSSIEAWAAAGHELQCYNNVNPAQVAGQMEREEVTLIDVRNQSEWDEGHIPGARHIMLGYLAERVGEIPSDKPVVVQCRTGGRSAIGASILKAGGIPAVANLMGGIRDWELAGLPISSP